MITILLFMMIVVYFVFAFSGSKIIRNNFTAFMSSLLAWAVLRYVASIVTDPEYSLRLYRAAMSFSAFAPYFFFNFSTNYPFSSPERRGLKYAILCSSILSWLLINSQYGVVDAAVGDELIEVSGYSVGYTYYTFSILASYLVSLWILVVKRKKSERLKDKRKLSLMLSLIVFTFGSNIVFGLTLDYLDIGLLGFTKYAEFPTFLFAMGVFVYGVGRSELFSIRSATRRLVGALGGAAILGVLVVFLAFVDSKSLSSEMRYVILAIAVVVYGKSLDLYARLFDQKSEALFYKTNYSLAKKIVELDSALLAAKSVGCVGELSARILSESLGASYIRIVLGYRSLASYDFVQGPPDQSFVFDENDFEEYEVGGCLIVRSFSRKAIVFEHRAGPNTVLIKIASKVQGAELSAKDEDFVVRALRSMSIAFARARESEEFESELRDKVVEATEKLKKANKKLRKADKDKDEFISMASHQLRTPLAASKTYVSLLKDSKIGKATSDQKHALDKTYDSLTKMVAMIDELLDAARFSSGTLELVEAEFDLAEMISEELASAEASASQKQVSVKYESSIDGLGIVGDRQRIADVVSNFLDNAIKYSAPGSRVNVSLVEEGANVTFSVDDNGVGIPKNEQSRMFKKFSRASNARKKRPDGTGLGLYIAKKVILMHGGSISLSSAVNKGTTISFQLPVVN